MHLAAMFASLVVTQTATGGVLRPEQAAYDVQSYDVTLKVDPKTKSISGRTVMVAKIIKPIDAILLDLDSPYQVDAVQGDGRVRLKFERGQDTLRILLPKQAKAGEQIITAVSYHGVPRLAPNAPWTGGFQWAKTPSGADWISVSMQNDGADLLFPVKDHPSDKPATAAMHITVPNPLVAVGPGRLENKKFNDDGTTTYNWRMTNPIPNYSILFNAAPYKELKETVRSVAGDAIPISIYYLPENEAKVGKLMEETKKYVAFMEKYNGPFPFRSQKLGIVESVHLGMEHSTAIAYGNRYRFDQDGFDWLLLHELGHEWWANLVTAADWKDFWIHEGFQTYMDALYREHTKGKDAYLAVMNGNKRGVTNKMPVAPRQTVVAHEFYSNDIYSKGALVLHALRYLIGDEAFFRSLRRMAYPDPAKEKVTDGSQTRLVSTDDFVAIAEKGSGQKLGWFFEVYVRQPLPPKLVTAVSGDTMTLRWETPGNLPFPMPIDVIVDGRSVRVPMTGGEGSVRFTGATPVVDPQGWVYRI